MMIRILKDFGKAFIVGIFVFIIWGVIQFENGYTITSGRELLILFLYNQMYSIVLYMVNAYYVGFLLKQFPNRVFKAKNILKGVLGGIVITLLSLFVIRIATGIIINGKSISEFLSAEQMQYYYTSFIISVIITSIFYAVYYYRNKQQKSVTEQKIIAGTASAKFDALKNQLDPHFLFNSLNVLTSLIEENPEAATRFTSALSKVYRYVLEQKNKKLVTLEEELKFAKLYMSLLAVRFEDSIVFNTPKYLIDSQAKVVPLSLQLLLENAVKHNQVTFSKKLYITIKEEDGNLVVTNNMQPKQVLRKSTGVGLRNIRDRYKLLTQRLVTIQENGREFSVSIPVLNENIEIKNTLDTFISEKKYKLAQKKIEKLKAFYINLSFYILFVPVFIYLNYISHAGFPWALFPIVGWGIGVLKHAFETFNYNPFFRKEWEERKIHELMEKDD